MARTKQTAHRQLEGFLDFMDPALAWAFGGKEDGCRWARDQGTRMFDSRTNAIARDWKPVDDNYTVADMTLMRDKVMALLLSASRAIDAAAASPTTYKPTLRQAQAWLVEKQKDSLVFTNAIHQANASGIRIINAPGFKRWVINSLNKVSVAYGHVMYMNCIKPGLLTALEAVVKASDAVVSLARFMLRVVLAAGEQILKLPDTLNTLWTYTKWGGIAALAYYVLRPGA